MSDNDFFKSVNSLDESNENFASDFNPTDYDNTVYENTDTNDTYSETPDFNKLYDDDYMKTRAYSDGDIVIPEYDPNAKTKYYEPSSYTPPTVENPYTPPPYEPPYNPYNSNTHSTYPPPVSNPYGYGSEKKPNYIAQIIIAICLFVSMFVIPVFPEGDSDETFGTFYVEFFENIDEVDEVFGAFTDPKGIYDVFVSSFMIMALGFFVVSILLLIASIIKNKAMCIVSSIIGIFVMLFQIISTTIYGVSEGAEINEEYFEFVSDMFGPGIWIPIILFVIHIIVTACTKKSK